MNKNFHCYFKKLLNSDYCSDLGYCTHNVSTTVPSGLLQVSFVIFGNLKEISIHRGSSHSIVMNGIAKYVFSILV